MAVTKKSHFLAKILPLFFTQRDQGKNRLPVVAGSKAPLWRKVVPGRRVARLPELPWASQLFLHFLTKLGEHEKQKVGSAGRVTRLAGSPFFDGRGTLLAGPTFLHINTLARDNQSMRERCWLAQRGQLFSHINAR